MASISLINPVGSSQNPSTNFIPLNGNQENFIDSRIRDSNSETSCLQYIDIIPANDYNLGIQQNYNDEFIKIGDIDNNSVKGLSLTINVRDGSIDLRGEILSNFKGSSLSQNLRIKINGTFYKIPLHAD
jgi:hypothetical protein